MNLELLNNFPQFSIPGTGAHHSDSDSPIQRQFVPFLFCIPSGLSVSL